MENFPLEDYRQTIRDNLFQVFDEALIKLNIIDSNRSEALRTWFECLANGTFHDLRIALCMVFECKTGLYNATDYIMKIFWDSEHIDPLKLRTTGADTCHPYHQFNNATNLPTSIYNLDKFEDSVQLVKNFYASANSTEEHPSTGYVRYLNFDAFFDRYIKPSMSKKHMRKSKYKVRYGLEKQTLNQNTELPFPKLGAESNVLMRGQRLLAWIMPWESIKDAEKTASLTTEQIAQRLAFPVTVDENEIDKSLLLSIVYPADFRETVYQPTSVHPGWPINGFVPAKKDHTCYGATCSCIQPPGEGFPERIHIAFPLVTEHITSNNFRVFALGYIDNSVDLGLDIAFEETLHRLNSVEL